VGSRLLFARPTTEGRFAAYIEGLANAAGHADRHTPLKNYCKGLLLPESAKSVEPMAARLAPNVFVACISRSIIWWLVIAPWNDGCRLLACGGAAGMCLPTHAEKQGPE